MDISLENGKNEVIEPLKHLLSLDLERTPLFVSVSNEVEKPRKSVKQVKKVRFLDEVEVATVSDTTEEVFGFDIAKTQDFNGSIPLHGDPSKFHLNERVLVSSENPATAEICVVGTSSDENEAVKRTDGFPNVSGPSKLFVEDTFSECNQDNFINSKELPLTSLCENINGSDIDVKANENSDCSELIEETKHLTVSSVACTDYELDQTFHSFNNCILSREQDTPLQNETSSLFYEGLESSNLLTENKNSSEPIQDRPKKNLPVSKQSSSLNSVLNQEKLKAISAVELRSAVFSAWFQLKTGEKKGRQHLEDKSLKKTNDQPKKVAASDAFASWRKSKMKTIKVREKKDDKTVKTPTTFGISVKNEDENEMAFRSWKKEKDKLLKQQFMKNREMEQERRRDSLMNESMKKKDSELAFFAWKVHKSQIIKKEKKEIDWMLQNEKETLLKKMERSDEALKEYYLWLKSKHTSKRRDLNFSKNKPPWIPP